MNRTLPIFALFAAAGWAGLVAAAQPSVPSPPAAAAPPPPLERQVAPVFRCIFEDRSRMVIVRASPDLWVAFNPGACAVQKAWRGSMKFRGKVWDFSQDNCAAGDDAVIILKTEGELASIGESTVLAPAWTGTGLEAPRIAGRGEGWRFSRPDSSLVSPVFDASGWERVFIAFDETGRSGAFRVEVSDNVGVQWRAQAFESTTHGTSDTDWQFNFKLIEKPAANMRVRWTPGPGGVDKKVRAARVFGDRSPWSVAADGGERPLKPVWRGYERPSSGGPDTPVCVMLYELNDASGRVASVRHEVRRCGPGDGWDVTQHWAIEGAAVGTSLRLRTPLLGVDVVAERVETDGSRVPVASGAPVDLVADARGAAALMLTTRLKGARP